MRFSIITPSFNQGEYLEGSIKSVLSQGYHDLEYIIIDGGSTDDSLGIIRKYEHELAWWISERDKGHGDALNKGFNKATGDIYAWLNSDDQYTPWAFEVVAEIFAQHPDVEWITGMHGFWDKRGRLVSVQPVYKNIYDYVLGRYAWIQQESVFFRSSLFERAGNKINDDYKLMVDGELWCRFFQLSDLWHVSTVLSGYRMHGNNRAQKSIHHVHKEMKQAINIMTASLPSDTRRIAMQLRMAESTKRALSWIPLPLDLSALVHHAYNKAYTSSNYNTLDYDLATGCWRKGSKPMI